MVVQRVVELLANPQSGVTAVVAPQPFDDIARPQFGAEVGMDCLDEVITDAGPQRNAVADGGHLVMQRVHPAVTKQALREQPVVLNEPVDRIRVDDGVGRARRLGFAVRAVGPKTQFVLAPLFPGYCAHRCHQRVAVTACQGHSGGDAAYPGRFHLFRRCIRLGSNGDRAGQRQ